METTEPTTSGSSDVSRYARARELRDAVAPNMPTWEAPADAPWNTPKRASVELGYLLEAIEMPESGLADDFTFGATLVRDWDDICDQAAADEQDAKNLNRVIETAATVEGRLEYLAEWVPPQGMEYIRQQAGLKLLERFEALARNYEAKVHEDRAANTTTQE